MRDDEDEPCAWMDHILDFADGMPGEAEALGHSGAWDSIFDREDWQMPGENYPAVSLEESPRWGLGD